MAEDFSQQTDSSPFSLPRVHPVFCTVLQHDHTAMHSSLFFYVFLIVSLSYVLCHTHTRAQSHKNMTMMTSAQPFYTMYCFSAVGTQSRKMSSQAINRLSRQQSRGIVSILGWKRIICPFKNPGGGGSKIHLFHKCFPENVLLSAVTEMETLMSENAIVSRLTEPGRLNCKIKLNMCYFSGKIYL